MKEGKLLRTGMIAFLLAASLTLTGKSGTVHAEESQEKQEEALNEMILVAENESLELYFDEVETDIAIKEKSTGQVWFSNPVDIENDTVSSGYYQKLLKSQIVLTYINESTQSSTMNNYTASIEEGQFEVEKLEDGIKITYMIGEGSAFILLPEAIDKERMEGFLETMSDSQKKKINRNYILNDPAQMTEKELDEISTQYPAVKEKSLYILRGGVKDYLKEELAGYFEEAGYTEADFELDTENIGYEEGNDSVWFQIPLTYRLEGETLLASIDPKEIVYNDNGYYLVNIDLLKYFGASMKEDGYLFVPDGSGALIYFNNGKTSVASYGAQIYGQDKTMIYNAYYESQIDVTNTIKMPVFGIKEEEKALFAVIEGGDANAVINAEVSGKTTGYNDVYASFSYLQYGTASLDDMVGANSYYMYSNPEFEGDYAIRYAFLSGEEADYSGMAKCYREYLVDRGILSAKSGKKELPFYVEYIGAIDKSKTMLGVKYTSVCAVTTFAQAKEISGHLQENGVEDLRVVYSGWMNGGLHGTAATGLNVVSGLNHGGVKLSDFMEYTDGAGIPLYMTVDLQYVYKDKMFDGYSAMKYAPRYFDNTNIKVVEYGLASRVSEGELASLISPYYVEAVTEKLTKELDKKSVSGVGLGTLSWELYSDLLDANYTDRQMAKGRNTSAVATMKEADLALLGDNANAYIWGYVNDIINVPLFSNHYMIIDEEIPFYEMVVHGYIQYAGKALNLEDDYKTSVLKSVESGAGLNFKWIYEENSILKETDYDSLYSVNYEAWLDQAIETYKRLNEEMGYLQGEEMVAHEILLPDVVKVTYSDGSIIYVNYTDDEVTVDGILIGAKDFTVKKAGGSKLKNL